MIRTAALDVYQGDDYSAVVNVTRNGIPVDLAGYTAYAQIRRQSADLDSTVDATVNAAVSGSTVILSISHTVTVGLSGCYAWDLELTSPTGSVQTILKGPVHVSQEVTRVA